MDNKYVVIGHFSLVHERFASPEHIMETNNNVEEWKKQLENLLKVHINKQVIELFSSVSLKVYHIDYKSRTQNGFRKNGTKDMNINLFRFLT